MKIFILNPTRKYKVFKNTKFLYVFFNKIQDLITKNYRGNKIKIFY